MVKLPPLREAFMVKLRTDFYGRLKKMSIFESWTYTALYGLVRSIVESKSDEILQYLDTQEVTLGKADQASEEIIGKILLPEVRKIRI